MNNLRIGQGIDVHAFSAGRKLFLGGLEIPHDKGLAGHSDADVLLHAITDALLGALGWGDLGTWFPDTDERYRNADSKKLLLEVWNKAHAEGWQLVNCDSTVLAETPKLSPHIEKMRLSVAKLFQVSPEQVSIKATTNERLGFVGREEGILATSVVLLMRP